MNKHHGQRCPCCECSHHRNCILIYNPRWTCLMPKKINEILIGPINLNTNCIFKVKQSNQKSFKIVDKYVHPDFLTHLITLTVITPSFIIMKPGELLTSLCPLLIQDIDMNVIENNGKQM